MFSRAVAILQIFFILAIFLTSSESVAQENTNKISPENSSGKLNSPQWTDNASSKENYIKETAERCKLCSKLNRKTFVLDSPFLNEVSEFFPTFNQKIKKQDNKNSETDISNLSEFCRNNCQQYTKNTNKDGSMPQYHNSAQKKLHMGKYYRNEETQQSDRKKRHIFGKMAPAQNDPLKRERRSAESFGYDDDNLEQSFRQLPEKLEKPTEKPSSERPELTLRKTENVTKTKTNTTEGLMMKANLNATSTPTNKTKPEEAKLKASAPAPIPLQKSRLTTVKPLKARPTTVQPLKAPPTTVQPLKAPATTVQPLKAPPTTVQPLSAPLTTVQPLKGPPTTIPPLKTPLAGASPIKNNIKTPLQSVNPGKKKKYIVLSFLTDEFELMLSDKKASARIKKLLKTLKNFAYCALDVMVTDLAKWGINFPMVRRKHCPVNSKFSDFLSLGFRYGTSDSDATESNSDSTLAYERFFRDQMEEEDEENGSEENYHVTENFDDESNAPDESYDN